MPLETVNLSDKKLSRMYIKTDKEKIGEIVSSIEMVFQFFKMFTFGQICNKIFNIDFFGQKIMFLKKQKKIPKIEMFYGNHQKFSSFLVKQFLENFKFLTQNFEF